MPRKASPSRPSSSRKARPSMPSVPISNRRGAVAPASGADIAQPPFAGDVAKTRVRRVLLRQRRAGDRPGDADVGIVPDEARLVLRVVGLAALVREQRVLAD